MVAVRRGRELLLPGSLLPELLEGTHHATISKVTRESDGGERVTIKLTDLKQTLELPVEHVLPHMCPVVRSARSPAPLASAQPPKKKARPRKPTHPAGIPRQGEALEAAIAQLGALSGHSEWPPGTLLWVRGDRGLKWPAVAWAPSLCDRHDMADLLLSRRPTATVLVRYYGQHSHQWAAASACERSPEDDNELLRQLNAWGRNAGNARLVALALSEMAGAHANDSALEVHRLRDLFRHYQQQRAAATPLCSTCHRPGGALVCGGCERNFSPLCLHSPALTVDDLPEGCWECPCCCQVQRREAQKEGSEGEDGAAEVERMGLTPDTLIAAALVTLQLEPPTTSAPVILGLLDPCTNSHRAPNIPAEKMYDKTNDGLKLSNSWAGFKVLLNPPFINNLLWRFVNRAIDEVESGRCPACVLIVRNSTDAAYFLRLGCYPRVMLRREEARFKDYTSTPNGFGIAIFCIVADKSLRDEMHARFFDAFLPYGEPCLPVDRPFIRSRAYPQLLDRLERQVRAKLRDWWVQCCKCNRWRVVEADTAAALSDSESWWCALSLPGACQTPPTRTELAGGHYVARGAGGGGGGAQPRPLGERPSPWAAQERTGNAPPAGCPAQPADAARPPAERLLPEAQYDEEEDIDIGTCAAAPFDSLPKVGVPSVPPFSLPKVDLPAVPSILPPPLSTSKLASSCQAELRAAVGRVPAALCAVAAGSAEAKGAPVPAAIMLVALELARGARIAANRVFMQHVQRAVAGGEAAALGHDDALVMTAAKEMARRQALLQAQAQQDAAQRRYEVLHAERQRRESGLLRELAAMREGEAEAQEELAAAKRANAEVQAELDNVLGRE